MQDNYLDFAVTLAQKAGNLIKTNFQLGTKKEWKGDDTPLTSTDKEVNQLVIDTIGKQYPTHCVIAEEGSNLKESEYTWVCDPIDGTIPFSHGYPTSVFALALTKNGESILGIIYDPYMDRLVTAQKGKGAFLNSKNIHVSEAKTLANNVVDVTAWLGPYHKIGELKTNFIQNKCHPVTLFSLSYSAMLVASGEFVGVIGTSPNPWDGAAMKIIVEEAGGKVTDLFGNQQKYNVPIKGIVASNGVLHDKLINMINPLIK